MHMTEHNILQNFAWFYDIVLIFFLVSCTFAIAVFFLALTFDISRLSPTFIEILTAPSSGFLAFDFLLLFFPSWQKLKCKPY